MVNPLLTIAFDIFLIGSAVVIAGGMVNEYLAAKKEAIGGGRRARVRALPQPKAASRVGTRGHGRRRLAA